MLRMTSSIFLISCSMVWEVENFVCLLASAHSRECNKAVMHQSRNVVILQIVFGVRHISRNQNIILYHNRSTKFILTTILQRANKNHIFLIPPKITPTVTNWPSLHMWKLKSLFKMRSQIRSHLINLWLNHFPCTAATYVDTALAMALYFQPINSLVCLIQLNWEEVLLIKNKKLHRRS